MSIDIDGMETLAKHGAYINPDAILALIARMREAEAREQALAAQVSSMVLLADEAYASHAACHDKECALALTRLVESRGDTTSLARRDAEQRADGMHQAMCVLESEFDPCHPIIERIGELEAEERRQADQADKEINE